MVSITFKGKIIVFMFSYLSQIKTRAGGIPSALLGCFV